jgi:hypothetical protein
MSKNWPPKGAKLTKEERQAVPVLVLYCAGTWSHGSANAIYLRRPVPYVSDDGHNVRAVFFRHCAGVSTPPRGTASGRRTLALIAIGISPSYARVGQALRGEIPASPAAVRGREGA